MLSLPIIANTTSSACLINSSQLPSQGYMEDLWHFKIAPACLSDYPLFICISLTGCHHPYAGKCIRRSHLFLPWYHWPSPTLDQFGTLILIHFNRLHVEGSYDAAMFASRCGPRCCLAPVPTWTSLSKGKPTELFTPELS